MCVHVCESLSLHTMSLRLREVTMVLTEKCDRGSSIFPRDQLFFFFFLLLDYAQIFMAYTWHINPVRRFYNL